MSEDHQFKVEQYLEGMHQSLEQARESAEGFNSEILGCIEVLGLRFGSDRLWFRLFHVTQLVLLALILWRVW